LKILQINASYKPAYIYGGPTMSVSKLSEQLVKAGCNVDVFTTTANGPTELNVITTQPVLVNGVPVTYFKRITKDHSHFSPALLSALWKSAKNYDVIHVHAWWNLVSVFSCLIAYLRNVNVLVSPRGTLSAYSFTNKSALSKKILQSVLGIHLLKRSHIHTTSTAENDAVLTVVKPLSIHTISNFVKLSDKKNPYAHEDKSVFKLLFFSRIEHKKGLDILINALPHLNIPYALSIAGDGDADYIDHLKKLAEENNVSGKINWLGFQNEDKFDLLNEHDLMVLPSYDENFGNVVIESLSVGTPVLISENVGLADYITHNKLGWLCKTDPSSVSAAINNIFLHEQVMCEKIRDYAPSTILNDFNDERLTKKYVDLYQQIINRQTA
jgi:glycosyltransferase involved in cell wall biosynthesis